MGHPKMPVMHEHRERNSFRLGVAQDLSTGSQYLVVDPRFRGYGLGIGCVVSRNDPWQGVLFVNSGERCRIVGRFSS